MTQLNYFEQLKEILKTNNVCIVPCNGRVIYEEFKNQHDPDAEPIHHESTDMSVEELDKFFTETNTFVITESRKLGKVYLGDYIRLVVNDLNIDITKYMFTPENF